MTTDGGEWAVRPYTEADQPGVEDLLDADADRLWVAQGHRLHGPARDGERWRSTVIAERAGRVVGAVTVARNRVHPGRYSVAVEVSASSRGQGLGHALVERARLMAPERLPMAAKVRPSDVAGLALLNRVGGRVYQECPGLCPDPTSPEVAAWATRHAMASDAEVLALAGLARDEWSELFARQYRWVHEDWSPAAGEPLRKLARDLVADVDAELSTITVRGTQIGSVTWVFDGQGGTAEIVTETTERHAPNGTADVAVGLARSLMLLNERGVRRVEIDGHVSDSHLAPVLDTFPTVPRNPLYLVELDPLGA